MQNKTKKKNEVEDISNLKLENKTIVQYDNMSTGIGYNETDD